jgi:hypothetical protein
MILKTVSEIWTIFCSEESTFQNLFLKLVCEILLWTLMHWDERIINQYSTSNWKSLVAVARSWYPQCDMHWSLRLQEDHTLVRADSAGNAARITESRDAAGTNRSPFLETPLRSIGRAFFKFANNTLQSNAAISYKYCSLYKQINLTMLEHTRALS